MAIAVHLIKSLGSFSIVYKKKIKQIMNMIKKIEKIGLSFFVLVCL